MKTEIKSESRVKITGNTSHHNFKIGEEGIVMEETNMKGEYKVFNTKKDDWWWVKQSEFELIESTKTLISNELILQAHKEACGKWKSLIEKECPELFKPKFKVGDWVVSKTDEIYKIEEIVKDLYARAEYGISCSGYTIESLRLATPTEIENHLIKVAKDKGFKEGVRCQSAYSCMIDVIDGNFSIKNSDLCCELQGGGDMILFDNRTGKWATIIEEPKVIELTMEDIAKLKGVNVSQIKIVK
jgi:hypothetical protein